MVHSLPMFFITDETAYMISKNLIINWSVLLLLLQAFYGPLSGTTCVSWYQKKHSPTHLSQSSTFLYELLPCTTIHSILPDQFTCLTIFSHNLSPSPLWSTSWSGASTSYSIHFFTQSVSSFRNTCPYQCNLFCCSTKIISPIPSNTLLLLSVNYLASIIT